ncbi:MAG: hypothetical protein HN712_28500 [Gemmatimonadetes bacterium]|nr:hypothetical protein [Gemmatimonadota bacterium]MBT7864285.1 hypothetical protein [Gemmatimonadota bacterium]
MRKFLPVAGLAATLAFVACSDQKSPMSSDSSMDAPEAAGRRTAAPVAGTAENRHGLSPAGLTTFTVTIANISAAPAFTATGVFNTPVGAEGPGPIFAGDAYEFGFHANEGARLSFALMYVQSNDLFLAPAATGIPLFEAGVAISGDVTEQVMLWDAGTEVNEEPGTGPNQAPRQAGPNTGTTQGGPVQRVDDGFSYPAMADLAAVTITSIEADGSTYFTVRVENASSSTPMAPGVYVIHADGEPLFTAGSDDAGDGLEALAEDGNPAGLAHVLGEKSGPVTILAPGVWAVHTSSTNPLFTSGAADAGEGLESLAEDGGPGDLAAAIEAGNGIVESGVFSTPVGADGPGALTPGNAYSFSVTARPGDQLAFATMFVQSNDLFFAPGGAGIALFSGGRARTRNVTGRVGLWDAGTEVNQAPGLGADQAPRQAAANTGDGEAGAIVQLVDDGFSYPATGDVLRVTITPQ